MSPGGGALIVTPSGLRAIALGMNSPGIHWSFENDA
jgi:hypothetical protein